MKSRRSASEFHREHPSTWQRHRSGACTLTCHYCIQARKFRDLSWRFIPSDKYAAFTKHERERKVNEQEEKKQRGMIIPHNQAPLIHAGVCRAGENDSFTGNLIIAPQNSAVTQ